MPKEIDEFLGDLNNTEENPFEPAKAEDLTEFNEPQVAKEEVKEEKPIPYHKNPEFKELKQQLKELKEQNSKLTELEKFVKDNNRESTDDVTDVFTRVIGNDTPEKIQAVKDIKRVLSSVKDEAREEALEYFRSQEKAQKQAELEAEQALNESFESIEESYGVDITSNSPLAKKTRNDFISFVQRIAPKDGNGNISEYPDLIQTFDIFQETRKSVQAPSNSRAKEIASRSISRSSETTSAKPTERTTWDSVSRIFGN